VRNPTYIPQALGSLGAQVGTGIELDFAVITVVLVEAEEICVEATAPVRTRATTKARAIKFMGKYS
jgi:hypothetical protein